jgi:hypothetical protein
MHILYTDSMAHLHQSHYLNTGLSLTLSHLDILILFDTIKRSPIHQFLHSSKR